MWRAGLDVVLADPDTARRAAIAEILHGVGWRVREHDRASAALDACRERLPAVLVVDEEACHADDMGVVDVIKQHPDMFPVGIVVKARRLDMDDALDWLSRGVDGLLIDPVGGPELVCTVRSAARVRLLEERLLKRGDDFERQAMVDGLTGIPNRRFLDRELASLVSAARRYDRPLTVALIDADRFKAINDTHGHGVGDEVLEEIGHRLTDRLRSEDHVGR